MKWLALQNPNVIFLNNRECFRLTVLNLGLNTIGIDIEMKSFLLIQDNVEI